jgi:chromosome segregation ATPase
MTGGTRIIKIDGADAVEIDETAEAERDFTALDDGTTDESDDDVWIDEDADGTPRRRGEWIVPALSLIAIAAWSGLVVYANQDVLRTGASLAQWIALAGAWAAPVAVLLLAWSLFQRNPRREAERFQGIAHTLSVESRALEERVLVMNRELSLARDFIAAQSRDLESLGRMAVDRLSGSASQLDGLVQSNGERIEALADISGTALANMERLRGDLPVIANSARDVTSQIGHAGESARERLDDLVTGFARLNEFGEASERQVESLRERIDRILGDFGDATGRMDELTQNRFATLEERSEAFRADLDTREVQVLAAIRKRADTLADEIASSLDALESREEQSLNSIRAHLERTRADNEEIAASIAQLQDDALDRWTQAAQKVLGDTRDALGEVGQVEENATGAANRRIAELSEELVRVQTLTGELHDAFNEDMTARMAALDDRAEQAADALAQRLVAGDAEVERRQSEHAERIAALTDKAESLATRLRDLNAALANMDTQGAAIGENLESNIAALNMRLEEGRTSVDEAQEAVAALTDSGVRLLEIIQASAKHSRDDLPIAIDSATERLSQIEARTGELAQTVKRAREDAAGLAEGVAQSHGALEETQTRVDQLFTGFTERGEAQLATIAALDAALADLDARGEKVAANARENLAAAIAQLEEANRNALADLEQGNAQMVRDLAHSIGDESASAIEEALRNRTAEAMAKLEESAQTATGIARDAAIQLRDQLSQVNDLAGNLEARVAHARAQAEEQVDNDFSRRMALITESLNSNAIDIAKAMSNEVTDIAWASYLKGDRGIFTRRAVRLMENSEARSVSELYDEDADFRQHVSRYIHDFEAMLRTMLSTRDGNALAVTILSSDMGKLYVALAQAIDRLRD